MPAKGKKTLNGYQLWSRENREKVKADGFSGREIMTELSKRWSKVNEKTKQQLKERAEKGKYNSFQLWCKDHRGDVAKEGMKPGEVMSELRRLWKDASDEEKQRYHDEIEVSFVLEHFHFRVLFRFSICFFQAVKPKHKS